MNNDINIFLGLLFYCIFVILGALILNAFNYKYCLFIVNKRYMNNNCYYYCFFNNDKYYKNILKGRCNEER